jgi:hypothetical protein
MTTRYPQRILCRAEETASGADALARNIQGGPRAPGDRVKSDR